MDGIGKQLEKARELSKAQQDLLQDRMNVERITLVKQKVQEVMTIANMKENLLRQRAKVDWIKLGDNNSAYFHAIHKSKHKQAKINMLQDSNGNKLLMIRLKMKSLTSIKNLFVKSII